MPSPHYQRSSRDDRPKGRYIQKSQQERQYGGQLRKKIHRDRDYEFISRDRYNNGNLGRDIDQRPNEIFEERPSIRVERKQKIQVKVNQQQSEIKVHFRFKPIKINPKSQQELMRSLKNHLSENIGPVEYFEKSAESYPGFLIIELGFRYDHDANLYFTGKKGEFEVTLNREVLNISPEPTKIFQILLAQSDVKKRKSVRRSESKQSQSGQKRKFKNKKRANSSSGSRSSSSSSPSKNSNHSKTSPRRQHRKSSRFNPQLNPNDREPYNQSRQLNTNYSKSRQPIKDDITKKYKKLYFFGIHYCVNSKDMTQLLYKHPQGPFYSQQFIWRKMNGSISQFLEGRFEQKQALKLLSMGQKMQVKGHPFIIIDSQSIQNDRLLQKISQFQINIQFPRLIEPYYLLKGLKECGRVIQIISNNKLNQQGKSDFFNVTFNSKEVCQKLKTLKKTSKGVIIQGCTQQNDAIFIYRPNSQTQLLSVSFSDQKSRRSARSNSSGSDIEEDKERGGF